MQLKKVSIVRVESRAYIYYYTFARSLAAAVCKLLNNDSYLAVVVLAADLIYY